MNLIIVAGVFTVIGALIEGLISHYGVGIFSRLLSSSKAVINCKGTAEENGLSFYGFENKRQFMKFEINNGKFEIKGRRVIGTGLMTTTHFDGSTGKGAIKSEGFWSDGFAYLIYHMEENGGASWNGVSVLEIPSKGDIYGYWLAEDIYNKGHFTFGKAEFKRI